MIKIIHRIMAFVTAAALCIGLCGCHNIIEEFPVQSGSEDASHEAPPMADDETYSVGELYGSYLTMFIGYTPSEERGLPSVTVFKSYSEVEQYYYDTSEDHVCGQLFTIALASFTDDFLAENDVMILALEEPSSYINHTAEPITVSQDKVSISITRHTPETVPLLDTEYRLIFTAPKGSFDGIDELPLELNIAEVIDKDNNEAFDAGVYRIYRPDYTSFCYRADMLTGGETGVIVDAVNGYDELVYFYDKYKSDFDLDMEFRADVGTLYSWDICERYILIAMIIPCASETEPQITDMFVSNLELFCTVEVDTVSDGETPAACYLLLTGIERRYLTGVDLSLLNLSME